MPNPNAPAEPYPAVLQKRALNLAVDLDVYSDESIERIQSVLYQTWKLGRVSGLEYARRKATHD
jgi:hypothetical protein